MLVSSTYKAGDKVSITITANNAGFSGVGKVTFAEVTNNATSVTDYAAVDDDAIYKRGQTSMSLR